MIDNILNGYQSVQRQPFSSVFLKVFILEELISPVVTPIILIFCLRRKSLEIIDFFRNFTVEVVGVGDTCSFAQMDIRQHGHPAVRDGLIKCSHTDILKDTKDEDKLGGTKMKCLWYTCSLTPSPPSAVDVCRQDRGVYLSAGRGREDRIVSDALCHHQPPVAASTGDHTLHQPIERASAQRGRGGLF